jgi:putative redox protein
MGPVVLEAGQGFRNNITAGKHQFVADEPVDAGGNDEGPTPYDFLASALGACTAMTMRVIAKREKIPLEGTEVQVTSDRMYAKDCADCTSKDGYIHKFEVGIKLIGNLTDAQRERLLSVAKRCPVAKTLSNEIRIEESLI